MLDRDDRILVIKLGALGDMVQAEGPFQAIRRHHGRAHITLLTTLPFVDFARATGCFDDVWVDARPRGLDLGGWLDLRRRLRGGRFHRVYDLQTSDRSSLYFRLMLPGRRPEWSGIAPGCSYPHANPRRDAMHTLERQAEQLAQAGIAAVPAPDLGWAQADVRRFGLAEPYVLLVPGGAAHRPAKRWPADRYRALATRLRAAGATPVLIGGPGERALTALIALGLEGVRDLAGETGLLDLAVLARGAAAAIGNDTGPMHVAAAAGCPTVVLYSGQSDPALCAQRGPAVTILRRDSLADLPLAVVLAALPAAVGVAET